MGHVGRPLDRTDHGRGDICPGLTAPEDGITHCIHDELLVGRVGFACSGDDRTLGRVVYRHRRLGGENSGIGEGQPLGSTPARHDGSDAGHDGGATSADESGMAAYELP